MGKLKAKKKQLWKNQLPKNIWGNPSQNKPSSVKKMGVIAKKMKLL
jgi:hypothetical protein